MINEKQLKRYCSEDISKIENYDLAINDDTQVWDCHHRLEIQGKTKKTARELLRCGLYWNRPADELIFLTHSEHIRLHNIDNKYGIGNTALLGRRLSDETRKKLSIAKSGDKHPMFGKHHSAEVKKMISERTKEAMRGMKYWNNGVKCVCSKECPGEGWVRGRLKRNNHK